MSSVRVAQRGDRAGEEDGRRVEDDRQAEQELPDVAVDAERRRQLAAEQLRADHRPGDDRDREHERDQEAVAHVALHRVHRHAGVAAVPVPIGRVGALHRRVVVDRALGAAGLGHRVADVARDRLAGAVIAALLHPSAQMLDRGLRGVEGHRRGLRNRVGVDGEHARPVAQRVLDDRLLGGVVQAADVQDRGLLGSSGRGAHGVHCLPSTDAATAGERRRSRASADPADITPRSAGGDVAPR